MKSKKHGTTHAKLVIALVVLATVSMTASADEDDELSQSCQYATRESNRIARLRDRGVPLWEAKQESANADESRDITWIYKHPELSPLDLEEVILNQCDRALYRIAPIPVSRKANHK